MMFDNLDLLAYIDGSTTFDEKQLADWVAADCRPHGIISQYVAIEICVEMRSICLTQEMWDYFRDQY